MAETSAADPERATISAIVAHADLRLADLDDVVHAAPVDLKGDANSRGKIELTWEASDENRLVVVTEYQLQRKIGRDGKWKNLATIEPTDKPSYIDKAIQSRVDYYYRVISLAEVDRESPIVRDEDLTLATKEEKKTGEEAGPYATKRDVFMMPTRVKIGQQAALEFYEGKMPNHDLFRGS